MIPLATRITSRLSTRLTCRLPTLNHQPSLPYSTEDNKPMEAGLLQRMNLSRPLEAMILRSRMTRDLDLAKFFAKAGAFSIWTLGGMTILGTMGLDTGPIIAGIGVTGFTLGFALKEIATNFLSGVMLVFNKPFEKGQYLRVMGTPAGTLLEGTVESIDARYVLLRTKDRGLIMVPSVIVYTQPILVIKDDKKEK